MPRFLPDPDLPPVQIRELRKGNRAPNGLLPRTDAMARMMARGVQGTVAYRACFNASCEPRMASVKAWRIAGFPKFRAALDMYRERMEDMQRQHTIGMRDFVLGRLTHEAQRAPEAAARIKALDLLGKSEGMWTTVHRTEKALSPKDITELKAQLDHRLRHALSRLNPRIAAALSHDTGSGGPSTSREDGAATPTPGASPLISMGSHPKPTILSPSDAPIFSPDTPTRSVPGGVSTQVPSDSEHRDMLLEDLL